MIPEPRSFKCVFPNDPSNLLKQMPPSHYFRKNPIYPRYRPIRAPIIVNRSQVILPARRQKHHVVQIRSLPRILPDHPKDIRLNSRYAVTAFSRCCGTTHVVCAVEVFPALSLAVAIKV